jgi:hypothetical protein
LGWAQERETLAAAADRFDVLLTADKSVEFQQNLAALPMSIIVMGAHGNRVEDLSKVVPAVLAACQDLLSKTLVRVVA